MNSNELCHFGILGMKWGVRRYQNPDGSLTAAGKARYSVSETRGSSNKEIKAQKKALKIEKKTNKKTGTKYIKLLEKENRATIAKIKDEVNKNADKINKKAAQTAGEETAYLLALKKRTDSQQYINFEDFYNQSYADAQVKEIEKLTASLVKKYSVDRTASDAFKEKYMQNWSSEDMDKYVYNRLLYKISDV